MARFMILALIPAAFSSAFGLDLEDSISLYAVSGLTLIRSACGKDSSGAHDNLASCVPSSALQMVKY